MGRGGGRFVARNRKSREIALGAVTWGGPPRLSRTARLKPLAAGSRGVEERRRVAVADFSAVPQGSSLGPATALGIADVLPRRPSAYLGLTRQGARCVSTEHCWLERESAGSGEH